jgi:hypothetical protein
MIDKFNLIDKWRSIRQYVCSFLIIGFIFSSLLGSVVHADERQIFGLTFFVDSIRQISGGLTEVVLEEKSVVVPDRHVDRVIVEHYFRSSELSKRSLVRFNHHDLRRFVMQATRNGRWDIALFPLYTLSILLEGESDTFREVLEELLKIEPYGRLLLSGYVRTQPLSSVHGVAYMKAALEVRDVHDLSLVSTGTGEDSRAKFLSVENRVVEQLGKTNAADSLFELLIQSILSGQGSSIDNYLQFVERPVFDEVLGEVRKTIKQIVNTQDAYQRFRLLLKFAEDRFGNHVEFGRLFSQPLAELSSKLVENQNFGEALGLIAEFPFERRTPVVREALLKVLTEAENKEPNVTIRPRVFQLLSTYAKDDLEIKQATLSLIRASILVSIEKGELKELGPYWTFLSALEPYSLSVKSALQYEFIKKSYELNILPEERARIAATLPFYLRIKSKIAYFYYIAPLFGTIIGLSIFIFGIILLFWRIRFSGSARQDFSMSGKNIDENITEVEDLRKRFTSLTNVPKFRDPRIDEYYECLSILRLDKGSSLADIKSAYRNLVKSLHPDLNQEDHNKRASDDFMKLKSAYLRLIELKQDSSFTQLLNNQS